MRAVILDGLEPAATVALLPINSVVSSNKSFDANASNSALAPGRGLRSASRLLLFRAILESSLNATELAFLLPENAGAPTPKRNKHVQFSAGLSS